MVIRCSMREQTKTAGARSRCPLSIGVVGTRDKSYTALSTLKKNRCTHPPVRKIFDLIFVNNLNEGFIWLYCLYKKLAKPFEINKFSKEKHHFAKNCA